MGDEDGGVCALMAGGGDSLFNTRAPTRARFSC